MLFLLVYHFTAIAFTSVIIVLILPQKHYNLIGQAIGQQKASFCSTYLPKLNSKLCLATFPGQSDKLLEWLLIKEESSEMAKRRYNRIRTQ